MRKVSARTNVECKMGRECKLPARPLLPRYRKATFPLVLVFGAPLKRMPVQGHKLPS